MAYNILKIEDDVVFVRVSDCLRPAELKAMQAAAAQLIRMGREVKLLVLLENFYGWERSEGWGDVGFLTEQGDQIARMAIVGDECWREDVFLFVGKGLRKTEIEFFSPSTFALAQVWLRD